MADAARNGDKDEVHRLLLNEADPNEADLDGWTPLHEACKNGHDSVSAVLLEYGAEPNVETPLHAACVHRRGSTVKLLFERARADPNPRKNDGTSPLHAACENGNLEVIKLLLEYNADPKARNNDGRTPLHAVCSNGDESIASLLMESDSADKFAMLNATDKGGWTPLHEACENFHFLLVELLLKNQADPNVKNFCGWTPLHAACKNGRESLATSSFKSPRGNGRDIVVKLLLLYEANPNAADFCGWTPLHEACKHGLVSIVKLLLQYGAEPNATTKNGWTILHEASKFGHEAIITILLKHGANAKARNKRGWTPVHEACKNGRERAVTLLIKQNADPNAFDMDGRTPLHEACTRGHDMIAASLLLDYGANPNTMTKDGGTPLHAACECFDESVVKVLLQHGANPNAANKDGWTPLHETCKTGQEPVAVLLLTKQAFPNAMNTNGSTPLHEACKNGHCSIVALLWQHGANPNAKNNDRWTPLLEACKNDHDSIIALLLQHGANPNTATPERTPLLESIKNGSDSAVSLLLEHEACPNLANDDGWTPLHEACAYGREILVKTLLQHKANPNAANKDGWTPVHAASTNGNTSIVKLLLVYGADPNATSKLNWTPLHEACKNGHEVVVSLLLRSMDKNKLTPFDIANRCGHALVKTLLLENAANLDVANTAGLLPTNASPRYACLEAKALDQVLHGLKEGGEGEGFSVYTGSLDAMNDNLVAEARSSGISVNEITHAMFACEESRTWLHNLLLERPLMSETLVSNVVSLLCFWKSVDRRSFTDAILYFSDGHFRVSSNRQHEALNLADYTEVPSLHVEQVRMKAHKHLNGVYQLVGERIVCALVPHKDGVKYFLRNDCADFVKETKLVDQLGTGPCRAQDTVEELVAWGCDKVLAWKLLTCSQLPNHPPLDDICDQLVQSFKVISNFRMQLKMAINAPREGEATRLLGSKNELRQSRQDVDERFAVNRRVYNTAQRKCGLGNDEPLEPFSSEFLEQDASKTHMKLLSKLIERAKKSDVNTGKTKHKQSYFDARIVAFLGALNGGQVSSSLVSKYARTQYCYQDDGDTKGLCTPFSNLVVIATTGCQYIKIPEQVQSLPNAKHSLNNWVALRAAFEFDSEKGIFRYNTPEFQHANKLIKRSLVDFILDVSRRFSEVFEASPDRVYVSHLERLCDKIAELSGASSAWLLREMVSRYIKKGARVESSGRMPKDGYGRVETEICQAHYRHPASTKFIYFDRDVNIEGVLCRVSTLGKVFAREIRSARRVELRFRDGQNAPDYETAKMWLKQGMCKHIVLSDTEWSLGHHHVVETNFV